MDEGHKNPRSSFEEARGSECLFGMAGRSRV